MALSKCPNPKIVALIEEGQLDKEGTQILRIYNDIKRIAGEDKLWYMRQMPVKSVGAHRKNRGGLMCGGKDCIGVLETVDAVGYDPDVHRDATAFEEGPQRLNEAAFVKLTEQDDLLRTYEYGEMEAASVACTHFNQSLAAADAGVLCEIESISIDGRLSKQKLMARHPRIAPLFSEGLTWCVWKFEAEVLYPELPDIAQRAINAKHVAQQQEGWNHAYQRAVVVLNSPAARSSPNPGLFTIKDILKTCPKCKDDVPFIVDTAQKFGGTSTATCVDPLMRFVRMKMPTGRIIPGAMWKALGGLKLTPDAFAPHFITSILMLLAGSPAKTAPSKIAKTIGAAEISSLEKGTRNTDMKVCENIIKSAIAVSSKLGLSVKDETRIVGDLRTSLVCKLFEKQENLRNVGYKKLANAFFLEAEKAKTTDIDVSNPWPIQQSGKTQTEGVQSAPGIAPTGSVGYSLAGEAEGIYMMSLKNRGFDVDSAIKDKEGF